MAPKNKLTSPRKVEKALTEVARASGVPEERTSEALAGFVRVLVEAGFDEAKFATLNNEDLLSAARVYFASHPSASESKDPAGGKSLAPMARRKGPKTNWQR